MEYDVTTTIKEVLDSLGVEYTDIVKDTVAGQIVYQIIAKDPSVLLGTRGEIIQALDHLVRKIIEQKSNERVNFIIDVNEFQTKRIREIEARARMMAERARSFEYDVEMPPMSAYERLIVHSSLAEEPNITTLSKGEGRDRRITICYKYSEEAQPVEEPLV